ncbi:MAG: ATP-binding protein, partial [Alphaproteobacteria bacterium]|nr:ATP-binding protein [Alphaproteobacteria bacterium]
ELLDFSRVRDLELEATNIDRWLRDVLDEQLLPEGVTLSFEPGLPESLVPIDCERLRRAVVNVVENAVQAIDGEETEGQVTVSTVRAGDNFEIRIKDTGPGIPEDLRKRIFEPLFSTKNSGCGLGLAISKEIIEQHGGTIGIEDGPSGGTCFVFRLPS